MNASNPHSHDEPAAARDALPDTVAADVVNTPDRVYIGKMETRITQLESRFDAVLPTLATKQDIAGLQAQIDVLRAETRAQAEATRAESKAQYDVLRAETNGRFDAMHAEFSGRFDAMHAEFSARFDAMHAEFNGRFDAMHAEFDGRFAEINGRFEATKAEFAVVRAETAAQFERVHGEIALLRMEQRAQAAEFMQAVQKMGAGFYRWIATGFITSMLGLAALILSFANVVKPYLPPPPAQSPATTTSGVLRPAQPAPAAAPTP